MYKKVTEYKVYNIRILFDCVVRDENGAIENTGGLSATTFRFDIADA